MHSLVRSEGRLTKWDSVFGTKLLHSLAPVERAKPTWSYILLARALDIVLMQFAWGNASKGIDSVVLGGLLAAISRSSIYAFEHSYFLLSSVIALHL